MAVNTQIRRASLVGIFPHPQPGHSQFTKGSRVGLNQIALSPFANKRTFGSVTLIQAGAGGGTSIRPFSFFIAGVDRSEFVGTETAPTINSQVNSKATANFKTIDISGAKWVPTEGDEVNIYEGTTLIFNGWITRTVEERLIGTVSRVAVTCGDAGVKLSQRVVNAFYDLSLYGSAYFIVQDLVAKHMADLGITYVSRPALADLLPIGDQLFYCTTITEALNQLAKLMNADWVVDVNKNLRFVGLSDAVVNSNAFTDSSGNWYEVQATRTIALEGNRIFAKSSAQLLQTQTDTFPGSPGGLYIMTYPPRDPDLLPIVKVNGVAKIVVGYNDASSGVPFDFYRIGTGVSMNGFQTPLSSSDTVTVTYPSPVPYVAMAEDVADQATNGLKEVILECGNVTSKSDLQAIADAWLLRLKERATQLSVRSGGVVGGITLPPSARSWQPGELVSVNLTSASGTVEIVDNFLVDTSNSQIGQNTIRLHALTLSNAQYQRTANPAKFLTDIIARLRTIALPRTQVLTLSGDTDLGTGYVLNVDQQIDLDSSNGDLTVILPAANEMYGKKISFMKISTDSNVITIAGAVVGGVQQDVNGETTQTISLQYQAALVEGNAWQ